MTETRSEGIGDRSEEIEGERNSPPESGGVARSAGVVPKRHFAVWQLWNHPSRDPLRDPAALLTQEGNSRISNSFTPRPQRTNP
jgi:hypothetical protein